MKELFILGNGFDLAHGIKCGYLDFRNYLQAHAQTKKFLSKLEDAYGVYNGEYDSYKKWWRTFEKELGDGSTFELDFEAMAFSDITYMVDDDGEPMPDIEDTLSIYWEHFYAFMGELKGHVSNWIESLDLSDVRANFSSIGSSNQLFLTFNYTEVLESIYRINSSKILHIHGTSENPIIGHGNKDVIQKYREEARAAENKLFFNDQRIYDSIADFYEYTLKDTDSIVSSHEDFWKKLKGVNKVSVFGHSLGDVDLPYFITVKNSIHKDAEWYFYIYTDKENPYKEKRKEVMKAIRKISIEKKKYHILSSKRLL